MANAKTDAIKGITAQLEDKLIAVDQMLKERLRSQTAPRIDAIGAHLIEAGGKRIRPLLTLASAHLVGYAGQGDVLLATAIEYIHTATLLHDDVIDESDKRRGRPTANRLWDNTSCVLVGDYLFSRAFQLMVETGDLRVLDILSAASCTISEGEVLQLTAARDITTSEEIYRQVVRGKTAALFSAATEAAAVLANCDTATRQALFDYGDALGISFQIVDDLLDVVGDPAKTGKNCGDDFRERKLTLPMIKAIAKTPQARDFWHRTITKGEQNEGDFEEALGMMHKSGAIQETKAAAEAEALRAQTAIAALPASDMRDLLGALTQEVVSRIS